MHANQGSIINNLERGSGREPRRHRIIEGRQGRVALITSRKPNHDHDPASSPPPFDPSSGILFFVSFLFFP